MAPTGPWRRHGPCRHQDLALPERTASSGGGPVSGPAAVVAAHIASAEALAIIAGAATGEARARHVRVQFGAAPGDADASVTRATDIPWTPECFACGGTGSEMTFS